MDMKSIPVSQIVEHLVFANTPRSLFEALKRTPEVLALAHNSTPTELAEHFKAIASKLDKRVEDVACAYALLVALGTSTNPLASSLLESLPVQHFEWGATFRELIRATIPAVSVERYRVRGTARQALRSATATSSKVLRLGARDEDDDSRKTDTRC